MAGGEAVGVGIERGADGLGGRCLPRRRRVAACQELVQQHAERVDVRGGADRLAAQLLRGGVVGRQRTHALAGELVRVVPRIGLEQLGDAEVEQLHVTFAVDQDVAWLDVAVDHEMAVRVGNGLEHDTKERHALGHAHLRGVAVAVDALPVHELEHEVRLAAGRDAGVEQAGDVGVREPCQELAFALETQGTGADRRARDAAA